MSIVISLLTIGLSVLSRIFQAFVLTKIWLWFFVASFAWLPILPLPVAIGMCFFFALVTYDKWYSKEHFEKSKDDLGNKTPDYTPLYNMLTAIVATAGVFLMSWVFHLMF